MVQVGGKREGGRKMGRKVEAKGGGSGSPITCILED